MNSNTDNKEGKGERESFAVATRLGHPFQLSSDQYAILESQQGWLTDDIIDKAQSLLTRQFQHIDGLQDVCLLKAGPGQTQLGSPSRKWVQVILVGDNHWVTVSNLQGPDNTVQWYDSLLTPNREISEETRKHLTVLSSSFVMKGELFVDFADMQQQTGSSDCGLFALATATALCFGDDPAHLTFDQNRMRTHLLRCFCNEKMTRFPLLRKTKFRLSFVVNPYRASDTHPNESPTLPPMPGVSAAYVSPELVSSSTVQNTATYPQGVVTPAFQVPNESALTSDQERYCHPTAQEASHMAASVHNTSGTGVEKLADYNIAVECLTQPTAADLCLASANIAQVSPCSTQRTASQRSQQFFIDPPQPTVQGQQYVPGDPLNGNVNDGKFHQVIIYV